MEVECYTFYVKPSNKHEHKETINSTASAQVSFCFWHYQWRQQPQASFWWGKLYKHLPSLTFQIRGVKFTSRNENREVNLAMNAVLPHSPCKQSWDVHVSVTENLPFCKNMLELLNGKGGTEREVRCLYTVPALVQWGIAIQNSISYHVNQPLQNNFLELSEASRTGVDGTWLCSCFARSAEAPCHGKLCLGNSRGLGAWEGSGSFRFSRVGGWRGKTCTQEIQQAAACLPALWLEKGRFHHPPASRLLRARSPAGSVHTEHFIQRTQIVLNSGVSFCQIPFIRWICAQS